MRKILKQRFFENSTPRVARELLGKYVVRRFPSGKIISAMITEVEAYDGFQDKASHAHRGKTKRNFVMFGPAGVWYVYFTYGMHWMLNIVCGRENYPAAILIRGIAADRRGLKRGFMRVSGPGRITKFFKSGKNFNNKPANRKTGLWIEDRGMSIKSRQIRRMPRIGVEYAGRMWAGKPYRFILI